MCQDIVVIPHRRARAVCGVHGGRAGFTLIEVMVVVVIVGALAAVAIPAFSRYIKRSRTAEAVNHLSKLWLGAVAYFEAGHNTNSGTNLPPQFPATPTVLETQCCTFSTERCPGNSAVYRDPSWMALNFLIADPHLYVPSFGSSGTGQAATFVATAQGDLDCDGRQSTFQRRAWVNASNDVYAAGGVYVDDELE